LTSLCTAAEGGGFLPHTGINVMKKFFLAIATALALIHVPAQAVDIGFTNEFSGGTDCAIPATGCSILTATAIAGGVHFEFQGTMVAGEFVSALYGNFNGGVAPTVANVAGNTETFIGFEFGSNAFKADGDGFFDWKLTLDNAPPGNRFNGTDMLSWDFLGLPLSFYNSISVNGPVGKNGFLFATHAQGLADGGSGWFNGAVPPGGTPFDVTPVPEPETYALFMAGLAAVAYMQRRRKKQEQA